MIKLFELIKKNFKLLVRAKVSALIIFIGPLLLVSLLGLAYSQSSEFTLTASVYSTRYSAMSESLITKMTNQDFKVTKQDSMDLCIASVKMGESQACIGFPEDMSAEKQNELTFFVDYSQINLVWLMLDVMSTRVSERSDEISAESTSDIMNRLWFVEEKLKAGKSSASAIKTGGTGIKEASNTMDSGFKKLDISVDFSSVDLKGSSNITEHILSLLSSIDDAAENMSADIKHDIDIIENSATTAGAGYNDTALLDELEDIDDAGDRLLDAIDNATSIIQTLSANASMDVDKIKAALDSISQKMSETELKMSSVKKQRDELLPEFGNIGSKIDSMIAEIDILQGALDEALQKILAVKGRTVESISAPITTKIEPVATQKTHFNSLFPTLLVLIMMITGILLSSTLVMVEKKSKAFFRNSFTPTSHFTFNLSTYITSLIVLLIQLLLFVSVSAFFFETEVLASVLLVLLLVLLASTVFICIGMFIGFIFKTEETTNLAAITLIAVFLLFSSAVIPLESLPGYLKHIAMFNPFVVSEVALRQSIIFQMGIENIAAGFGILAGYALGIFALLFLLQNVLGRLSFKHFSRIHFNSGMVKEKKASKLLTMLNIKKISLPKKTDIHELTVNRKDK